MEPVSARNAHRPHRSMGRLNRRSGHDASRIDRRDASQHQWRCGQHCGDLRSRVASVRVVGWAEGKAVQSDEQLRVTLSFELLCRSNCTVVRIALSFELHCRGVTQMGDKRATSPIMWGERSRVQDVARSECQSKQKGAPAAAEATGDAP